MVCLCRSPAGRLRRCLNARKLAAIMTDTAEAPSQPPAPIADSAALRAACRAGRFDGPTVGQAPGRVQANPMAAPKAWADDFAVFCRRNPKPCRMRRSSSRRA